MRIPEKALIITNDTSARDVAQFLTKGGDKDHTKLVAKHTDEGIALFYKTSEKSSVFARLTGKARDRRELARSIVDQVFSEVQKDVEKKLGDTKAGTATTAIFTDLRKIIKQETKHAFSFGQAQFLGKMLDNFDELHHRNLPPLEQLRQPKHEEAPKLDDVPMGKVVGEPKEFKENVNGKPTTLSMPTIEINGKTYAPEKYLAAGGFGTVFRYQNTEDQSDKIAVKTMIGHGDIANTKITEEISAHHKASEGDQPNILKLHGAVKLEGGGMAVALELAPNGTMHDFAAGLQLAQGEGRGQLPKDLGDLVRLTLLKDTASGLQGMHDKGLAHDDFKSPNVMIGSDGKAKLIDFGDTKDKDKVDLRLIENQNVFYNSPNFSTDYGNLNTAELNIEKKITSFSDNFEALAKVNDWNEVDGMSDIKDLLMHSVTESERNIESSLLKSFDAHANDNWGLGLIAAELLTGHQLENSFEGRWIYDGLAKFEQGDGKAVKTGETGGRQQGALYPSSGEALFDDMVNSLLKLKPSERSTGKSLLENNAFNLPGVDSKPVRDFIKEAAPYLQLVQKKADLQRMINSDMKNVKEGDEPPDRTKNDQRELLSVVKSIDEQLQAFENSKEKFMNAMLEIN